MKIGNFHISPTRRGWTIFALVALLLSSYTADAVASIGRIRAGVVVGSSLDLGGKTEEEARAALTEQGQLLTSEPVELFADNHRLTVAPGEIGFQPSAEQTLDDAMGVGRRGNFLVRTWHRVRALFSSTVVGWRSDHDAEAARLLVSDIASRVDTEGHEAGIEAQGPRIVAVGPVPGRRLDHAAAVRTIIAGLESWPRRSMELPISVRERRTTLDDAQAAAEVANRWVGAPVTLLAPDGSRHNITREVLAGMLEAVPRRRGTDWTLQVRYSPERVSAALGERMRPFERRATNASFAVSGTTASVVTGQNGLEFDPEGTARTLGEISRRSSDRVGDAQFSEVEPGLTTEQARNLNITELVSTFTTNHPCCQPRVANIHKIADSVDGAIVRPGQTFSLNGHVGPRTTEKGYVLAPMIFDGEFRDDVGGGVSQFATTMFNAIFFGGYKFETYKAHSYYISRYPAGREATISWPRPDLAFTNNSRSGILIKANYSSTSITVSFYGSKEGKTVRAEAGERTNFTEPPQQRKANPAMAPGEERVAQSGAQGFDITVTRIITQNGQESRQRLFTRYRPQPHIVEYGPGEPPPPSPAPDEQPPAEEQEAGRLERRPAEPATPAPPPG